MSFKEWLKIQEDAARLALVRNNSNAPKGHYRQGEYTGKPPPVAIGTMKKK